MLLVEAVRSSKSSRVCHRHCTRLHTCNYTSGHGIVQLYSNQNSKSPLTKKHTQKSGNLYHGSEAVARL